MEDEKKAFVNALWFFSSDFYNKITPKTDKIITNDLGDDITQDDYVLERKDEKDKKIYLDFAEMVSSWDIKLYD